MAWIESHQALQRHPKTLKLAAILGESRRGAIGMMHCLWWWAIDYAPSGDLGKISDAELVGACDWGGETGVLRAALRNSGFLDPDDHLHDWDEYAGRLLSSRRRDAKRKRDVRRTSGGRPTTVHRTDRHTVQTQPNPTDPTQQTKEGVGIPDDLKANEAEVLDWLAFKREKGQTYKGTKGIEALWRMLRAIPADQRRAAVDHSMANNYSGLFAPKGGTNGKTRTQAGGGASVSRPVVVDAGRDEQLRGVGRNVVVPEM
jgi:hypothetical protein